MEKINWTLATNQKDATKLIRDAFGKLGQLDPIRALLPAPLTMNLSAHDTGCQLTIFLDDDEHPVIVAWTGSVWYNSGYEFNDRDKLFGINPEVAFVEPIIKKFFDDVFDLMNQKLTDTAQADAEKAKTAEQQRSEAISHYASKFPPVDDQVQKAYKAFGQPAKDAPVRITEVKE